MARALRGAAAAEAERVRGLNDTVQVNLKVKEHERRRLVEAAKAAGVSLNGLLAGLAMRGLDQGQLLDTQQIVGDVARVLSPLLDNAHELRVQGDYRDAVRTLALLLKPQLTALPDSDAREALRSVLDRIEAAERLLDIEAANRFKRMRTTGAQS